MATYYFLGGGTSPTDWNDSSNWYDAPSGGSSGYAPTNTDDVFIFSNCDTNSGSTPSVNSLTINNCTFSIACSPFSCLVENSAILSGNITMTSSNQLTVTTSAKLGSGNTITGNVTCSDGGIIGNGGSVTITGNLTFGSTGTIDSNSTNAVVSGNLIIDSSFTGVVEYITANNVIYVYGYTGSVSNLTLGSSPNTFYSNYPTLYYNNAANDGDWSNRLNWWVDNTYTQQANEPPLSATNVEIYSDVTTITTGTASVTNLTIGGSAPGRFIDISITINGTANFNEDSYYGTNGDPAVTLTLAGTLNLNNNASIKNNATIDGNGYTVNFNNSSTNAGTINAGLNVNANYPLNRNTFNTGTITPTISYSNYQTFYFNAGSDWYTLSNWYLSDLTTNAPYIPGALDDVQINTSLNSTASNMYAKNVTVNGASLIFSSSYTLYITDTITINSNAAIGDSMNAPNVECTDATFDGTSYIAGSATLTATGTVSFNDSSELGSSMGGAGNIIGQVNFYDTSEFVSGTLTGNASFNDSSTFTGGTITGDATVYSPYVLPFVVGGTINGNLLYSGYSARTVYYYHTSSSDQWNNLSCWWDDSNHTIQSTYVPNSAIAKDNVTIRAGVFDTNSVDATVGTLTVEVGGWIGGIVITCDTAYFYDSTYVTNDGTITQSVNHNDNSIVFYDLSYNDGIINPDTPPVEFRDNSTNNGIGTINGDVEVYFPSPKPIDGTINGTITYIGYTLYFGGMSNDGDWNNTNNWYSDLAASIPYNNLPSETIPYQDVVVISNITSYGGAGSPSANNLSTYGTYPYVDNITIMVDNLATFSQETYLNIDATINGDVLFEDLATNRQGTITGTATFTLSAAEEMISNGYGGTYGDIEFQYGKGVNGSSILGIV